VQLAPRHYVVRPSWGIGDGRTRRAVWLVSQVAGFLPDWSMTRLASSRSQTGLPEESDTSWNQRRRKACASSLVPRPP